MTSKQDIERAIVEALREIRAFHNIKVRGQLDWEKETLDIQYKQAPSAQDATFYRCSNRVEQEISDLLQKDYPAVRVEYKLEPSTETHILRLTRYPFEGTPTGPEFTINVLSALRTRLNSISKYTR